MENLNKITELNEPAVPVDNKAEKRFVSRIGFGMFAFSAVLMATQFICMAIIGHAGETVQQNFSLIILMLPGYVTGILALLAVVGKVETTPQPNREKFSFGKLVCTFLVTFSFMYVGNIVGSILNWVISFIPGFVEKNQIMGVLEGSTLPQTIIVVVIAAPIVEELVFRKLLIDRLGRYGDKTAIIVSAAAFGLFHGNVTQLVYAFLIGLVLGYVYRRTGNVVNNIVIHILLNFNGSVISLLVLEKSGIMEFSELMANGGELTEEVIMQYAGGLGLYMIYVVILMAMVIAGIVIFLINRKKLVFSDGKIKLEKGKRFNIIAANVGAVLFVVTWVIMIIVSFL